jgi:hypothetical protein
VKRDGLIPSHRPMIPCVENRDVVTTGGTRLEERPSLSQLAKQGDVYAAVFSIDYYDDDDDDGCAVAAR